MKLIEKIRQMTKNHSNPDFILKTDEFKQFYKGVIGRIEIEATLGKSNYNIYGGLPEHLKRPLIISLRNDEFTVFTNEMADTIQIRW